MTGVLATPPGAPGRRGGRGTVRRVLTYSLREASLQIFHIRTFVVLLISCRLSHIASFKIEVGACCCMQALLRLLRPAARMPTEKARKYVQDKITTHKARTLPRLTSWHVVPAAHLVCVPQISGCVSVLPTALGYLHSSQDDLYSRALVHQ